MTLYHKTTIIMYLCYCCPGELITVPSCLELVPTDYPQLTILNTSNSTLSSYMCMDGMIPEMRMESVCTRNGTWEPDPGQLNCTLRRTEDISGIKLLSDHALKRNEHTSRGIQEENSLLS